MPGYDIIAANETQKSKLICPECRLVLKEPVQTEEGIRLCDSCFKDIERQPTYKSGRTGISVVGEDGKTTFCFRDKAVCREVEQLEVQCNNNEAGCKWVGKLIHYVKVHESECQFKPGKCPDCGEITKPTDMAKHRNDKCRFRHEVCGYCGEKLFHYNMQEHHNDCNKYPIKCELCQDEVSRENVEHHKQEECKYVKCFCGEVLNHHSGEEDPKSLLSHTKGLQLLTHLIPLFNLVHDIQNKNSSLETRLRSLEDGRTPTDDPKLSDEISKFRKDLDDWFRQLNQQLLPLKEIRLRPNYKELEEVGRQLASVESRSTRQEKQIAMLKRQLENQSVPSWNHPSPSSELGQIAHLERKYEEMERQVTRLKVHVSEMELQLQASLASTYNGRFMWKIPDLRQRKQDAIFKRATSLYSLPFYTAKDGYKMCIKAYLNGKSLGRKKHLSLFFVLMKGEFDALLKWPFDHKVSLILVDQNHCRHIVKTFRPIRDCPSFHRPVSDMNVAYGCPLFCKITCLYDETYTKGDVLFIKCIVDTSQRCSIPEEPL